MLVIFDLPDEIVIPIDALEDLITKSSMFSLCSQWQYFGGTHLDNIIIATPEQNEGENGTT